MDSRNSDSDMLPGPPRGELRDQDPYDRRMGSFHSKARGAWMHRGRGGQFPHFNSPFEHPSTAPGRGAYSSTSVHRGRNDCTWATARTSKHPNYNFRGDIRNRSNCGGYKGQQRDYRRGFSSRGEKTDFMVRDPKHFNIRDYIIPAMTENPWAKLEAQFEAERANTE